MVVVAHEISNTFARYAKKILGDDGYWRSCSKGTPQYQSCHPANSFHLFNTSRGNSANISLMRNTKVSKHKHNQTCVSISIVICCRVQFASVVICCLVLPWLPTLPHLVREVCRRRIGIAARLGNRTGSTERLPADSASGIDRLRYTTRIRQRPHRQRASLSIVTSILIANRRTPLSEPALHCILVCC